MADSILTPYRLNAAPEPRETRRKIDPRAMTFRSGFPLAAMAIAFFLPAAQDCNGVVISASDEAVKSAASFVWIAPTYFGAAFLVLAILHAWTSRRTSSILPLIAVTLNVISSTFMAIVNWKAWWLYLPALLAIPIAASAFNRTGIARLSLSLDAYALLAIPIVALNVEEGRYWGAYLFIASWATLATLRATHAVRVLGARVQRTSNG